MKADRMNCGKKKAMKLKIIILITILLFCTVVFIKQASITPQSYTELTLLNEKSVSTLDIARVNLLCAKGLPNTKQLNVGDTLKTIDYWAKIVQKQINRYKHTYYRNPARYENSMSKFLAINLVLSIQQDLRCAYNKELMKSGAMTDIRSTRFFANPQDIFLHGFTENRKGSCSSLPVLVVAIGRKCNMPLFLVTCKGHLFCRWDDGKERFNIEASGIGVDIKPDSYYRNWPHRLTKQEVKTEGYLKSLTPSEELSIFSQIRGTCFLENREYSKANEAFQYSLKAFPNSKYIKNYLTQLKGLVKK